MSTKKSHAETVAYLEKRLAVLRLRKRVSERKVKERRKYLLGAYLDAYLPETGKLPEKLDVQFGKKFDGWLTRDSDRALFGLPPLKESAPADKAPETRTITEAPIHQKVDAEAIASKAKKTKTSTISAAKRRQARDLVANGLSLRQAALKLNVCRSTLSDVLSRGK